MPAFLWGLDRGSKRLFCRSWIPTRVPDFTILKVCEKPGLGLGFFSFSRELEKLSQQMLSWIPLWGWTSIYHSHSGADIMIYVEITAKHTIMAKHLSLPWKQPLTNTPVS